MGTLSCGSEFHPVSTFSSKLGRIHGISSQACGRSCWLKHASHTLVGNALAEADGVLFSARALFTNFTAAVAIV